MAFIVNYSSFQKFLKCARARARGVCVRVMPVNSTSKRIT